MAGKLPKMAPKMHPVKKAYSWWCHELWIGKELWFQWLEGGIWNRLKQAGQVWNRTFANTIKRQLGFKTIHSDAGVYILHHWQGGITKIILILYVYDLCTTLGQCARDGSLDSLMAWAWMRQEARQLCVAMLLHKQPKQALRTPKLLVGPQTLPDLTSMWAYLTITVKTSPR